MQESLRHRLVHPEAFVSEEHLNSIPYYDGAEIDEELRRDGLLGSFETTYNVSPSMIVNGNSD
jgi:hypothetical protein